MIYELEDYLEEAKDKISTSHLIDYFELRSILMMEEIIKLKEEINELKQTIEYNPDKTTSTL